MRPAGSPAPWSVSSGIRQTGFCRDSLGLALEVNGGGIWSDQFAGALFRLQKSSSKALNRASTHCPNSRLFAGSDHSCLSHDTRESTATRLNKVFMIRGLSIGETEGSEHMGCQPVPHEGVLCRVETRRTFLASGDIQNCTITC
jgi:hypothetical protein